MSQQLADLDEDERSLIGPYLTVSRPSGDEWRGFCVEHEDLEHSKTPSASYNFIRGEWHCMGCDAGGTIASLVRKMKKGNNVVSLDSKRGGKTKLALPDEKQIDAWVKFLQGNDRLMQVMLERRGLMPSTLSEWRIGYDPGRRRYTLPMFDKDGNLANLRLYDPHAKGDNPKILPYAVGYGTQLFNPAALENDEVVLTEGEWDCIINEQHGVASVSHNGGANGFKIEWAIAFKGKHVFICYDEDEQGRKGAIRTARMIREVVAGVYIMNNLNTGKKSGDVTDFYLQGGSAKQFRQLVDEARELPFQLGEETREVAKKGKVVLLEETQNPGHQDPLEVNVLVAGKVTPPYLAPRSIVASCDQSKGKQCTVCPMAAHDGNRKLETVANDPRLLHFIDASDTQQRVVLRSLVGAMCSDRIEFDVMSHWPMEELVVVQSVEHIHEGDSANPYSRRVFNVNTYATPVNSTVTLVGQQVADPRTSRGLFQSWHMNPVQVSIDKFKITDGMLDELAVFQTSRGQSPLEKCKEIAADLAANVTHIYGREMLHVAYDLVWHSVLGFDLLGKPIDKGWLECIVLGDTRTGKSEAATALTKHYRAGIVKTCEGATLAGLVGGAQQVGGRHWMITWGTLPLNDRRLVVLDEMSGLMAGRDSKGIIEAMSSIRSSGVAQLTKIVSEETSARTRLIWISNPIDGRRLSETPGGGMIALSKLVHNPEDIARFDYALALSNDEVDSSLINRVKREKVENVYTSDLSSSLVLWAWSRKPEHVRWYKGSDDALIDAAEGMGHKYANDPPLVQVENVRTKLARLAVAFACRTFSTNRTGEHVIVRTEHVHAAVEFLDWIYGTDTMGYLRHSKRMVSDRAIARQNKDKVRSYLAQYGGLLDALRSVMYADSFRPRDFEEFGGLEVDARTAANQLVKWRMVRRLTEERGRIVLEPVLVEVLKELEDEGI